MSANATSQPAIWPGSGVPPSAIQPRPSAFGGNDGPRSRANGQLRSVASSRSPESRLNSDIAK